MIDRCDACTGQLRETCDKRNASVAKFLFNYFRGSAIFQSRNLLTEQAEIDEKLMLVGETFETAMERDGCTLGSVESMGRLLTEVGLKTWEDPLPPEPAV